MFYNKVYVPKTTYKTISPEVGSLNVEIFGIGNVGAQNIYSINDLKKLADSIAPKMLVPIHTFYPEMYNKHFKNVVMKSDGQWWELITSNSSINE